MSHFSQVFLFLLLIVCIFLSPVVICAADSDVIINEIHYHPDGDFEKEEFIELYNRSDNSIDLTGWAFSRGITYLFPDGTQIAAHGYLVIARNMVEASKFTSRSTLLGDYEGTLSNNGEKLTLYNANGEIADSVQYKDSSPWVTSPDGSGASLERISPFAASDNPYNWTGNKSSLSRKVSAAKQNSVYSENLPPAIEQVTWNPNCPAPNKQVTVQVHITDLDGIADVTLSYKAIRRTNQNASIRNLPMQLAAGTAKDGTWTVNIPGQVDRTLVRFTIQAVDTEGIERIDPAPTEARLTHSYFHYDNSETSTIPIVLLYDFGAADNENDFRSDSAFIIRYPEKDDWEVYDFINITQRNRLGEGYDVRFVKHYELEDMSGFNLIFEPKPRYLLAEWLSYKIYESLGVIIGKTDHYRFIRNDADKGYFLMFEQANRHYISRHGLNNDGNLYKLHWSYDRNTSASHISELHEKRTNLSEGKDDIIETVQTMHELSGNAKRLYIESTCDVDQFINYFVGCQLISDWDGYFNNHFVYHDINETGLWYIFPWDKDKTWGDSDYYHNVLPYYDVYDMPVLFGVYGTPKSGKGSNTWWRPPGYFSGGILDDPDMLNRYLHRLGYAAKHLFTEEKWFPIINALEEKLEPEVRYSAQIKGENVNNMLKQFHDEIESFRLQVTNRREFILEEVELLIGPVSVSDWQLY